MNQRQFFQPQIQSNSGYKILIIILIVIIISVIYYLVYINLQPVIPDIDCVLSNWTSCENSKQTRTVITRSSGKGKSCGALTQTCMPPIQAVDCVMSDWSACENGNRSRTIITPVSGTGKVCGPLTESCISTIPDTIKNTIDNISSIYGRGEGYPWKFGDALNDGGMYSRCEADNGVGNCEKYGLIIYPKCKTGFTNSGCCLCNRI